MNVRKNKINAVNKVAEDFSLELQEIKPDYSYKLIRPKKKKNNAHVRVLYNQEKLRNIYKKKIIFLQIKILIRKK